MALPSLTFTHPAYLALLALLALAAVLSRRSFADLPRGRSVAALALRCVVLLLVVAAAAGAQWRQPSRRLAVLFLLDRSYSVPAAQREAQVRFLNSAATAMGPNDAAGVLVFGRDAYLELEPQARVRLGEIHSLPAGESRERSDLAGAIRLALAAFPGDAEKRIVLLSDGNENLGDAAQEATTARAAGVPVDVVPVQYAHDREVLLDKFVAPGEAKIGEPVEVRAVVVSTHTTTGTVTLLHNGEIVAPRKRLALRAGRNAVAWTLALERSDFHTFQALLEVEPGADVLPQNNSALGFTYVRGRPRVLIVEGDSGHARFLARALKTQQLEVKVVGPGQLPATLAEFQSFDSIVLSSVGAEQLSPDQMKMIASNVRDLGAGLIMVGGERSFGPGAYRGTPIEEVLPVDMEVKKHRMVPSGAVALVLHTCEFPDGNRWARETAAQVVDVLGEQDKIGVVLHEDSGRGTHWGLPMQPARERDRIKSRIYALNPGDLPDFQPILSMAYHGLVGVEAAVRHMIVISDGDPQAAAPELLDTLVKRRITVSTVAVFPHGMGTGTLETMAAATGGRFYNVTQPEEIPRIFLKEAQSVLKPAIIERPFRPRVDPRSELLPGIDTTPPLLGYVASSAKEASGVVVAITSDHGDPVLAGWRVGLGKSVAFTSDARNRWAAPWLANWGGNFARFWAQVVRWTLRSAARANFETSVTLERQRGRLTADVLDEQGRFVNGLAIRGSAASDRHQSQLEVDQVAPGRYESTFPAREKCQYMLSLAYRDARGVQRVHTVGTAIPYSPEYRDLKPDLPRLTRLAEASGGRLFPPLEDPRLGQQTAALFRHEGGASSLPLDIWPALLLLAALLFPLDVAVRRLMVSPAEAWRVLTQWAAARRGREALRVRLSPGRSAPRPQRAPSHARLLAAKETVVHRQSGPESIDTTAVRAAPHDGPRASPARPASSTPAPAAAADPPPADPTPGEAASHTRRLLDAKRRARGEE